MNNKGADQTALIHRLICTLLFAYGLNRFSHDMAQIDKVSITVHECPSGIKSSHILTCHGFATRKLPLVNMKHRKSNISPN